MSESLEVPAVLAEIQSGQGLALSAAGRLFPAHRGPGTVDPSTIFRWVRKGSKAADGRLIKLEAVRVGARWITSSGAVARFVAELTASVAPSPEPSHRTHAAGTRASAAAKRKLDQMGA